MSPYRRNVAVGLTVLGALFVLAWMILKFGGTPLMMFTAEQFPIRAVSERADGLGDGSPVTYRGVTVGRVTKVRRHPTDMTTIYIDATIDAQPPLPGNVQALIRTQGLIGGGAGLVLTVEPEGAAPQGQLRPNQELKATFVGLDMLPPQFAELATEAKETMRQFRESGIVNNLNEQITKTGKLIDSTDTLLNDPKLRENLQTSLANLREVSDSAKRITGKLDKLSDDTSAAVNQAKGTIQKTEGHIDDLARQFNDRLAQTGVLLDEFQSIVNKIDKGSGTAGRLVNDPRLYESLVLTTEQLNATIKDLKRLVEQWEQEGVSLKLR
jgi:phospholipid/cholesterol/gamma-HCH transport system substrate-binding protein